MKDLWVTASAVTFSIHFSFGFSRRRIGIRVVASARMEIAI
jgi:hypothetical protein